MLNSKKSSFLYTTVLAVGLMFSATLSNAQNVARAKLKFQIDSILNSQVNDSKIPGAVIEVKQGDSVIYKQAYGYAQKFDYAHKPLTHPDLMTTEDLFDIAS